MITRASLIFALHAAGVEASKSITEPLLDKYLDLDPFPDAKEALDALKRLGGYKLAILSNGNTNMLAALVKNSGLNSFLDATISVDGAGKFKPHPDCYALVEKVLGLKKDEVMFVSSNSFDVAGAKHFGFTVVWIRSAACRRRAVPFCRRKCTACCEAVLKRSAIRRIIRCPL